jgi:hypothetical protein
MKLIALIKPKKKIYEEVIYFKRKIYQKYGNETYLKHPPHLTIFALNVKKKLINQINKKNIKINNFSKTDLKLELKKRFYFKNDPITKKTTFVIFIKKNLLLTKIQKKLLKSFKTITIIKKKKITKSSFDENYKSYGYPFVNKEWKPHFSIVSINKKKTNDKIFDKFLKNKKNLKENFNYIYFYKYINNQHIFLWKSKITHE